MRLHESVSRLVVTGLHVRDVRFPTSTMADRPSDAVHGSIDFSAPYVTVTAGDGDDRNATVHEGHGFAFTLGRGNEIICKAVESHAHIVLGRSLHTIYTDFAAFWKELVHEQQLRWLGPEKGATHMAAGAILNALWDLWAKLEGKPLWQLIAHMTPEELCSVVPFQYISDALSKEEALTLLKQHESGKGERIDYLLQKGLPAYVTSVGWMGYGDEEIVQRCKAALSAGWRHFKMKVGVSIEDDIRRASKIRQTIGDGCTLMMDANQAWGVAEAIDWMRHLSQFAPLWIEEPTSPDDVLAHRRIALAMHECGIGVASGEHCCNRVVFKQLLQSGAIDYCQIDACRLASINEVLPVLMMAAKCNVPVCPHAGGVGLCELVQHIAAINYIAVAPTLHNVLVEYVDHLHEHFVHPVQVTNGRYLLPQAPGYSSEMHGSSLRDYEYPNGIMWQGKRT